MPTIHCVQKYGNISETLTDLDNRYEFVIVDAAARDSRELRTGIAVAHKLIVPFRPSQPDLDTLSRMNKIITQGKDLNPDLDVYALLTMASTHPMVAEVNEAKDYLRDYSEIQLLKSVVRDRKVFRDAMSEGLGVAEMSNPKAKREIHLLVEEIFND